LEGHISSIETMGLVDGPGIRTVVFFQGCSLRCLFCHNPDTQSFQGGEMISSDELVSRIVRFKKYFEKSGGGITVSGGEPLMQPDFLIDILKKCKEHGIHTCIDTAGVGVGKYDEILKYTDLVLYDVKAISDDGYMKMCKGNIEKTEEFQKALERAKVKTIIRAVIVPGINDTDEYMINLKKYIKEKIPDAVSVELLPYHKMGVYKYEKLGLEDPLKDTDAMDTEKCRQLWKKYFETI